MNKLIVLLLGAVALPTSLSAQHVNDSTSSITDKELELNEIVVVAKRPSISVKPDRISYVIKNDPYAVGLNSIELLERLPRVSVINDVVSVAGKNSVRYIIDGHLLEMTEEAVTMKLKNLQANGIEKIELLTTPPAKYGAGNNVAYISITTRNESLGTRGNIWGRGAYSDFFRYSSGANICHTTRKIEISGDLSVNDTKGLNDTYRTYSFADHLRTSDRRNTFVWRTLATNGLFKYKFTQNINAGVIVNYLANRMKSDVYDITNANDLIMESSTLVPTYPENALTLTGFTDWKLDSTGKLLSLTYNYFNKRSNSFADVSTVFNSDERSRLTKSDDNNYTIHSVKLDASLPFSSFKLETGAAFTKIGNNTNLEVANDINGNLVNDPTQSNHFIYDEKTAAAYFSAEKSFNSSFFGKLGLRYEHTDVTGIQQADGSRHERSYGNLFPTVNLSWNIPGAGRLSADYSMGITRPSFGDLNPFRYYTTVKDYFTGNPNLESVIGHNAGINYSYKGIYGVLYASLSRNAIGYITGFDSDGLQWTIPENCLNTLKTGLYASYYQSLFDWWDMNLGGEVFYSNARTTCKYYRKDKDRGWSGKIELNTSWMLNKAKTLIFNIRCTHFFPYRDKMTRYEQRTLLNCELRYMLLDNRMTLTASVSDPFGWSITKSTTEFDDYSLFSRINIHSHSIALRVAYSFGGRKVNNVYRDTKERESQRSY